MSEVCDKRVECRVCDNCPLKGKPGFAFVGGYGDPSKGLWVIGEQPGHNEAIEGKPFVGASGNVLNKLFRSMGLNRDDFYITNAIKCYAEGVTDDEQETAQAQCVSNLAAEFNEYKPKYILTLGSIAQQAIDGRKVTDVRGFVRSFGGAKIINTFHPAAAFRIPEYFDSIAYDFYKFSRLVKGEVRPKTVPIKVVSSYEDVVEAVEKLTKSEKIAFDIECDHFELGSQLLCVQFYSREAGCAYVFPWTQDNIPAIKQILECPAKKIGQNLMFDVSHLRYNGLSVKNIWFDTMAAHHLVRSYLPHDLNTLTSIYTDYEKYDDNVYSYIINKSTRFSVIPSGELYQYGGMDTIVTYDIHEALLDEMTKLGMTNLFFEITMPVAEVLIDLRFRGVKIDLDMMKTVAKELDVKIATANADLTKLVGYEINMNSSKQMGKLLYETIGLPVLKRSKKTGAPSCDKETVEKLLSNPEYKHPALSILRTFKQASKTRSTFLSDTLIETIERDPDHRIHTTYKINGTVTGRLSSEEPNLQNIPRGPMVRNCFMAENGFYFVETDFSQAELRVAAYLAKEDKMIQMFENGRDIHAETAAEIFKIPISKVDKETRVQAKFVVFGWLYGRGYSSIMEQYKKTEAEAKALLYGFENVYPKLVAWKHSIVAFAQKHRYLQNVFGRRRSFPIFGPFLPDWEREALNFNPQSIVTDVCVRSMHLINKYFKENNFKSRLIMNLHDAIMFEIAEEEMDTALYVIKRIMELPIPELGVGIPVDFKIGRRWAEEKKEEKKTS